MAPSHHPPEAPTAGVVGAGAGWRVAVAGAAVLKDEAYRSKENRRVASAGASANTSGCIPSRYRSPIRLPHRLILIPILIRRLPRRSQCHRSRTRNPTCVAAIDPGLRAQVSGRTRRASVGP